MGRKILLLLVLVALGGVTLGMGLGVGQYLMENVWQSSDAIQPQDITDTDVTSVRHNPAVIQINPNDPNIADIIPLIKDSVVSIDVATRVSPRFGGGRDAPGAGSGFIFHADDDYVFIATNNHVIANAHIITISLDDNESVPAEVVGTHVDSDLAVLAASRIALAEKGVAYTIAVLGNSDALRMGDTVVAIGNAMGEGQTVTRGIVSALNLRISIDGTNLILDVLQTDAAVNPGNSGGPLVDRHGHVIGIVTAKLLGADVEGMGYALPINEARVILFELMETGSIRQSFLGIIPLEITDRESRQFNLPSSGILIMDVFTDTPACIAGLQNSDFIVYFNGRRITSVEDLNVALISNRPGDEVVLGIVRAGESLDITVTLGSATSGVE